MSQIPRIAIIGAGAAGIAAASLLQKASISVAIFEKSRGLGGRCSTRRFDNFTIDHGAQYFTLRNEEFKAAAIQACGEDLLPILAPILNEKDCEIPARSPRYYHRAGNSQLIRKLAKDLTIRTETTVTQQLLASSLSKDYELIISTAPLPQTLQLAGIHDLNSCNFCPCLCLILIYRGNWLGKSKNAYAYSISNPSSILAWSACENHKIGRIPNGFTALVIHASQDFSTQYLESPPEEWAPQLQKAAEHLWEISPRNLQISQPHRWRYARNIGPILEPKLPSNWLLAGDSLCESRVESAWLNGRKIAHQLLQQIQNTPQ